MIRINKSKDEPDILLTRGSEEAERLKYEYDQTPGVYTGVDPDKKFEFISDIYAHDTVKEQLKADQYGKCCYCETKDIDAITYGDVEHLRPKGGYKQKANDRLCRPGYYWLAYNYDNLFYSCQICNQKYKRNMFPLTEIEERPSSHHDQIEDVEYTLLIHPSHENPEDHIGFREEIPFPKTSKGTKSIQIFGLNRSTLNDRRRRYYEELEKNNLLSVFEIDQLTQEQINSIKNQVGINSNQDIERILDAAKSFIDNCGNENFEYTAMARSYKDK